MSYITFQPSDYFNTKLYTGNNSTNAVTGVGFAPDFVWLKPRNSADHHRAMDAVSTASYYLSPNQTSAQSSTGSNFASFDSDGFTLGGSDGGWNNSSYNYVSWNWKANGSGSANTDGSISSTVSANDTAGFSIVKWTGTGSNATVGHGLSTAPRVIIAKNLGTTQNWFVFNKGMYDTDSTAYINLNTTDGKSQSSTVWQSTAPTSSVFSTGAAFSAHDYVAYCFSDVKGFSKSGVYSGNNSSDGIFVYTGFRPAWVVVKRYGANGDNWSILDSTRNTFNVMNKYLDPNSTNAEGTADIWDFTSNGFKMRNTFSGYNASGATYIYMAFAEQPFKFSNAR